MICGSDRAVARGVMNDFGGSNLIACWNRSSTQSPSSHLPRPARQVGIAHSLCHRKSSDTPLLRHALSPKRASLALHGGALRKLRARSRTSTPKERNRCSADRGESRESGSNRFCRNHGLIPANRSSQLSSHVASRLELSCDELRSTAMSALRGLSSCYLK